MGGRLGLLVVSKIATLGWAGFALRASCPVKQGARWARPFPRVHQQKKPKIFAKIERKIRVRSNGIGVRTGKIGLRGIHHQMQPFILGYGTWLWPASPPAAKALARGGALEARENPSKMARLGHLGAPGASGGFWGAGATGVRDLTPGAVRLGYGTWLPGLEYGGRLPECFRSPAVAGLGLECRPATNIDQRQTGASSKRKVPNGRFQMEGSKWKVPNGRFQMEGSKWKVPNGRFQMEGSKWKVSNGRFQMEGSKWKVPNGRFQTEGSKWKVPDGRFQMEGS